MDSGISCCICTKPVLLDRARRKGVTCSKECFKELRAKRRKMVDRRACRHCGYPSTPQERADFQKWRRAQPDYYKKPGRKKKPEANDVVTDNERGTEGSGLQV